MEFNGDGVIINVTSLESKDHKETLFLELIITNRIKGTCILTIDGVEGEISDLEILEEGNTFLYESLFKGIERIAMSKQLNSVYLTVSQNSLEIMEEISVMEDVILRLNWNMKTNQNIFIFDGKKMIKDNWLSRDYLNKEFSIENVMTVTREEIEEIDKGRNIWYPDRFYPMQYSTMGKNSLVMRYRGHLIGWCITCSAGNNMLMYDNLFVKEEFWNLGRSISLFGQSLKMQCEESNIRYVTFTVQGDHKPLLKVIQKRSKDYLVEFKELKLYEKNW